MRQIARELGHSWRTVRNGIARPGSLLVRRLENRPRTAIGRFQPIVDRILREDAERPFELLPSAASVYRCLRENHDYQGSYSSVRRYVLEERRRVLNLAARVGREPSRGQPNACSGSVCDWMLGVLQGNQSLDSIQPGTADAETVRTLAKYVRSGSLRDRNKAVCVIAKLLGIRSLAISRFLRISRTSVIKYWKKYRTFGCDRLFKRSYNKEPKSRNQSLRTTVFSVLHTPPSAFDINRTTWTIPDLRRVLGDTGHPVSSPILRPIMRAGYRWKVARKVLTSNDPNYQEKLAKIQSILSTLGPKERFFSIDEYGPFAVKMQGGRSLVPPGNPDRPAVPEIERVD